MISHILHTAFETVYEAETPADDRQAVRGEDVPLEEMDGLSDNHERREFNESISMMLFKRKNTIRVRELEQISPILFYCMSSISFFAPETV